jgi:hypothetical protein
MTHKHHGEKHAKKRHFMDKDHIHSKEKMASLKPAEKPAIDEKTENTNQTVEPVKQTAEIKTVSVVDVVSAQPAVPQRIFEFARKKNALEKLKDKFHQLIKLF